jgi:hypothetical protein
MSAAAQAWVGRCRLGGASRRAVMHALAELATDDGADLGVIVADGEVVYAGGIPRLIEHAEVSDRTATYVIGEMIAAGVVRRQRRDRQGGQPDLLWLRYDRQPVDLRPRRSVETQAA